MTKQALLEKLSSMLDEAARSHTYGTIEIQLSDGVPALLRTAKTEKLQSTGEKNRAYNYQRQSLHKKFLASGE
jgi:hypothetical protein